MVFLLITNIYCGSPKEKKGWSQKKNESLPQKESEDKGPFYEDNFEKKEIKDIDLNLIGNYISNELKGKLFIDKEINVSKLISIISGFDFAFEPNELDNNLIYYCFKAKNRCFILVFISKRFYDLMDDGHKNNEFLIKINGNIRYTYICYEEESRYCYYSRDFEQEVLGPANVFKTYESSKISKNISKNKITSNNKTINDINMKNVSEIYNYPSFSYLELYNYENFNDIELGSISNELFFNLLLGVDFDYEKNSSHYKLFVSKGQQNYLGDYYNNEEEDDEDYDENNNNCDLFLFIDKKLNDSWNFNFRKINENIYYKYIRIRGDCITNENLGNDFDFSIFF